MCGIFTFHFDVNEIACIIYLLSSISGPNGDYSNQSFPKYTGFERDVFKAIVEFFDDENKRPLVPRRLLGIFKKTVGK